MTLKVENSLCKNNLFCTLINSLFFTWSNLLHMNGNKNANFVLSKQKKLSALWLHRCMFIWNNLARVDGIQINVIINIYIEYGIFKPVLLTSFVVAFSTKRIEFNWRNHSAVQKSNRLELPQFMLIANETFECNESYGTTINGNYLVYILSL